ncbi:MAG TPA: TetR/AcrR family transcriptional regulator [Alphaproteobacteria bacterium]|nr:TetR/AcrR family transcriptional regulator [Alphaproteobacteria bacterium]
MRQVIDLLRKKPQQARAEGTVDTILEAAAQILQTHPDDFTTNRVAERAGFGIGTLYQYFPNKDALLLAIAERESRRIVAAIKAEIDAGAGQPLEARIRALVRRLIGGFGGRQRTRKAVLLAVLRRAGPGVAAKPVAEVANHLIERLLRENSPEIRRPTSAAIFVATRAVAGCIRAAVIEESPLLATREFEDEVVRLMVRALRADA